MGTTLPEIKDGQVDFTSFIPTLESFQADAIDYLYDLEPQSQNLFYAGFFYEAHNSNQLEKAFYNAAYRIRSIDIPMPKMEIDQNNVLRAPIFKNVNYSQEITIEWLEDVYHSVEKYHIDWHARWYNRQYDVLRCGVGGKFRQLTVIAYHYLNSDERSIIETPKVQPIMMFSIGGLIPLDLPNIKFDHSSDQNDSPVSIRYKCGKIQWIYSNEIGVGSNTGSSIMGGANSVNNDNMRVWKPQSFLEEPQDSQDSQLEQLRIVRSATSVMPSEGSIG